MEHLVNQLVHSNSKDQAVEVAIKIDNITIKARAFIKILTHDSEKISFDEVFKRFTEVLKTPQNVHIDEFCSRYAENRAKKNGRDDQVKLAVGKISDEGMVPVGMESNYKQCIIL